MPYPSAFEVCRTDLFTDEMELRRRFPDDLADKVLRVREMYNWMLSNPNATDREFVAELTSRRNISKVRAYDDLKVVKSLLPLLADAEREFHRWRYNEMILETYKMAKARKDAKTMERAATSYARHNRIDAEERQPMPYEEIVIQPFTATEDPTVLGIKPVPNIQERIRVVLEKYTRESADIEDIEAEEADLQFKELFDAGKTGSPADI